MRKKPLPYESPYLELLLVEIENGYASSPLDDYFDLELGEYDDEFAN